MAWTAPMTAVANAIFTAAQFNTHVRDNLLETAPAKASTAGGYFVSTGTNSISERTASVAGVAASETTTSTSFTNLATTGPTVTLNTGTSALILITSNLSNNTNAAYAIVGVDISGATTLAPADADSLSFRQPVAPGTEQNPQHTWSRLFTGLTAGSNTFQLKYRVTAGTGTFNRRYLTVIPF